MALIKSGANGSSSDARWPAEGSTALAAESTSGALKILVVPVNYTYGSNNTLPDTGVANLDLIKRRFMEMYPLSDISITVRESSINFSTQITGNGPGWDTLLNTVSDVRTSDNPATNVYYLGLVEPGTFDNYCPGGCVMGYSWLADQPGNDWDRVSTALGYSSSDSWQGEPYMFADTMVHEVGHAHGRNHSPAGNPDNIDPGYPAANPAGSLDVQGYSVIGNALYPASSYYDFMGYEQPIWVSSYTYSALFDRIVAVNELPGAAAYIYHVQFDRIYIDMDNSASFGLPVDIAGTPGGEEISLDLLDDDGDSITSVSGYFTSSSGLGGGSILFDADDIDYTGVWIDELGIKVKKF